jgi:hypothetical protein
LAVGEIFDSLRADGRLEVADLDVREVACELV